MKLRQQTLAGEIEYAGVGVHSGAAVTARLKPAAENHGVVFVRTDLAGQPAIPAVIENVADGSLMRQTTLALAERPDARVATVEHILGTLHGFGVDNCRVEIDAEEAPLRDGSAAELAEAIARCGVVAQDADRAPYTVTAPVVFSEKDIELVAVPSAHLRLTFFLDYPGTMIGQQALSWVAAPEAFRAEIAPARTFCLMQEIEFLRRNGLIKGGSVDSALVVDGQRLANPGATLRFQDEFVRHKILDLLGDLYLLGRPLRAHVLAVKSGHRTHAEFVRRLRKQFHDAPVH